MEAERMDSITRKIDELGRIIIPIKIREELGWKEKDDIIINMANDSVVLTKSK